MKLHLGVSLVEVQRLGQIPPTRALLPPPDETVPEDLFPPNGHATDEIKEELIEAEIEEAGNGVATEEQKEELSDVLRMYRDLGGILTEKEEERLDAATTVGDYTCLLYTSPSPRDRS